MDPATAEELAAALPPGKVLTILRRLARAGRIQQAAAEAGESQAVAEALARSHGWPLLHKINLEVQRLVRIGTVPFEAGRPPAAAARQAQFLDGRTSIRAAAQAAAAVVRPPAPVVLAAAVTPPAQPAPAPAPAAEPDPAPTPDPVRLVQSELTQVPLDRIHPDPDNARTNLLEITDLATSINQVGLLQPLVVRAHPDRPGHWILVIGHRRHAALAHLGWTTAPALAYGGGLDDVLLAMLVENGQRSGLNPIDEAKALQRLMAARSLTQLQAARIIGRSDFYVSTRLTLLDLSGGEQADVAAGRTTITQGVITAKSRTGKRHGPVDRAWHFSPIHPLGPLVAARCERAGHPRARRVAGGVGCAKCWEQEIRLDERRNITAGD